MISRVMLVVWFFLFLIPMTVPAQERDWSLGQAYIEGLLTLDEKEISLTDRLDEISRKALKDLYPGYGPRVSFKKAIHRFAKEIQKGTPPPLTAQAINRFLFENEQFVPQRDSLDEAPLEAVLLPKVLEGKQGNCLTLSLIFLCVAERLNIEASGVVLPGHFFVRQETPDTPDGPQNLEMTSRGQALPDAFYEQVHLKNIYPERIEALTKKEVLFVYISNVANHYKLRGYHEKAIELFQAALHVLPRNASIHTNLGNAYERNKEILKAGSQYQKALAFNPYLCETHYNLGLLHWLYTGMKEEAYRHGQVVRKLGCTMHPDFMKFLENYESQKNSMSLSGR